MANFMTRIGLNLETLRSREENHFAGIFRVDVEELNVCKEFSFAITGPLWSPQCEIIIHRDGVPFIAHVGTITGKVLKQRYRTEASMILQCFEIIFLAHHKRLNAEIFALTRIQYGKRDIVVTVTTPDICRKAFREACG